MVRHDAMDGWASVARYCNAASRIAMAAVAGLRNSLCSTHAAATAAHGS